VSEAEAAATPAVAAAAAAADDAEIIVAADPSYGVGGGGGGGGGTAPMVRVNPGVMLVHRSDWTLQLLQAVAGCNAAELPEEACGVFGGCVDVGEGSSVSSDGRAKGAAVEAAAAAAVSPLKPEATAQAGAHTRPLFG